MTINSKNLFPNNEPPNLPGLGGGGGGTDAITLKSMNKSFGKRVKDIGNILTRPFKETKVDPNEKFASEFPSGDGDSIDFDMVKKLGGLGGGGGGTNAITGKAKSKTLGAYMSDAFKISTIPARFLLGIKSPVDKTEKFADSYKTPEDKVSSAISSFNQNVRPDLTEQNNIKEVSTNINQSVEQSRTTTVIQPVVNNVPVPTPVPQPVPLPANKGKTALIPVPVRVNNSIAKLIK